MSRPGRRLYVGKDEIPTVKNGFGIAIVSTSRGVMTGRRQKLSIGGEAALRDLVGGFRVLSNEERNDVENR